MVQKWQYYYFKLKLYECSLTLRCQIAISGIPICSQTFPTLLKDTPVTIELHI